MHINDPKILSITITLKKHNVYYYTEMVVFNQKLVFWWGMWLAFILRFWKAPFSKLAGLIFFFNRTGISVVNSGRLSMCNLLHFAISVTDVIWRMC